MATVTLVEGSKIYHVKKIQRSVLTITGKGDNDEWSRAEKLSDFIYPWENRDCASMTFRALHCNNWLYCLYEVQDNDIKIYVNTNDKSEVIRSERVEIFFRKDNNLLTYYGLELDPLARVMDYEAKYHRKFNPDWKWPEGKLIVKADRTNTGYTVELAVHKESLRDLGLLTSNKIEAGIFRAECKDFDGHDGSMKWISWLKPDSQTPDFHIPSAFGVLLLEN